MADPFSSFGPEASPGRLAEQDLSSLAFQGAQTQAQLSHADLFGAQAAEMRQKSAAEKRMAEAMQAGAPGVAAMQNPADRAYEVARIAMSAGSADAAGRALHIGGQIEQELATARLRKLQALKTGVDATKETLAMESGVLRNSTDQASFDRNVQLYELATGMPSRFKGLPYDADTIRTLDDSTISAKDKLNEALRSAEARSRDRAREARERFNDERVRIEDERTKIREDAEARKGKEGVPKPARFPATGERDAARAMIEKEFPDLDKKDMGLAALAVASRAREMVRDNPALGAEPALRRALLEAQNAGDFEVYSKINIPESIPLVGGKGMLEARRFIGSGKTAVTPLEAPVADKPSDPASIAAAMKKLKKGRWYKTPTGTRRWEGDKFSDPVDINEGNR